MSVVANVENAVGKRKPRGKLAKLAAKTVYVPSSDDPREELKKLVRMHKGWTRKSVAILQMASDRKNHVTGEPILCDLPDDRRADFKGVHDALKRDASNLETAMMKELRKIPIYTEFLSKVFGFGPVVCAYLVAEVDIRRSEKISGLRMYMGLAVVNGHLVRPATGQKNTYNKELRTRLYQAMGSMWKNAAKKTEKAPHGSTTKYLDVWRNYKHRMLHSIRYDATKNTLSDFNDPDKLRKGAKAVIHSTGWHKAADVFAEDLYIVWRTLEGLPVWPGYYAAKLGYSHGGKICVNAPKMMTLEEALATVGHVGSVPLPEPDEACDEEFDVDAEAAE